VVTHPSLPAIYAVTPKTATVHEIDASALIVTRGARLAGVPASTRVSPDGRTLWALLPEQRQLARLSCPGLQSGPRLSLPWAPVDLDFAPADSDAKGLVVASSGAAGEICWFRGGARQPERVARPGGDLSAVRFRKDGRYLLIANRRDSEMIVFDIAAARTVVRLPLSVRPRYLAMKPDGGELYVTGEGLDAVVTVFPYQTEVRNTLLAGHAPGFLAATGGNHLFVANPLTNNVTIVDARNQRVIAVSPVGTEPCFVAVTPDNTLALVLNRRSGDVSVLSAPFAPRRTKSAPALTMIPVGSRPVSAVIRAVLRT
jgi:YVTN family beta-propeller protein